MFEYTPLLGAQSASRASQSILELDGGIKILIDVGWDESFAEELLSELIRQVPTISFILLTHPTIEHIGAYAHCCKHVPQFRSIPVYATTPVIALGRTLTQDVYRSAPLAASIISETELAETAYSFPSLWNRKNLHILRQRPSIEEIAGYFASINQLKYSQSFQPTGSQFAAPVDGVTITAHSAGHTLGGTIWQIQHGLESLVYAVDWNQAREHVLSGAAWLDSGGIDVVDTLRKPTALICSSRASRRVALEGGRTKRDQLLLSHIKTTIQRGGSVLIPTDSSARVLELAYLLEGAWSTDKTTSSNVNSLRRAGLFLASASASATIRSVRSMLEWMEEGIVRDFETAGANSNNQGRDASSKNDATALPFDFTFLRTIDRRSSLKRLLDQEGAKVIITSDNSLDWGFSNDVIRNMAAADSNLIILTEYIGGTLEQNEGNSTLRGGLNKLLWMTYLQQLGVKQYHELSEADLTRTVKIPSADYEADQAHTAPLEGDEIAIYQQVLARQRQLQGTMNLDKGATSEAAVDGVEDDSSSSGESSEGSDAELQGKALNISATMSQARNKLGLSDAELGIDILVRRKGYHDYDVLGKKGRERSFPAPPAKKAVKADDYGDLIRPEDYLRAEERDAAENQEQEAIASRKEISSGQKRKWADATTQGLSMRENKGHNASRRNDTTNGVSSDTPDASMTEDDPDGMDNLEEPAEEGPQKVIFEKQRLTLNIRIAHVDFSGMHDKRSLELLIPLIKPRKTIIVGGDAEETTALAEDCRRMLGGVDGTADVYTPKNGDTVNASVDTNAWMLRASKPFAKQINWQVVRGLGVVALTGRLAAASLSDTDDSEGEHTSKKIKGSDGQGKDQRNTDDLAATAPVIDSVPSSLVTTTHISASFLHVGDLRLAELRKLMQTAGFAAEFRGEGTLVINGQVAIRKGGTGKLEVEGVIDLPTLGGPDPTFYDVRRKVYEGLAIVSGS